MAVVPTRNLESVVVVADLGRTLIPFPASMLALFVALLAALRASIRPRLEFEAEILALRHQLAVLQRQAPVRLRLRRLDRVVWVVLSRVWSGWRQAVQIVSPDMVVRWHRQGSALYWRWRSHPQGPGRSAIDADIRRLIREMHAANPLWGAPRVHGELRTLGIEVAQTTVAKYLGRRCGTPLSHTWRAFLSNHVAQLASVDFFTVPTPRFRVLFVFVVLSHDRRRIVHLNVTAHPTLAWTAQQLREAWPWNGAPRFVIRDRDAIHGRDVRRTAGAMGIDEVLTALRAPWQNPFAERAIGSIRRECLDHVIVWNERWLRRHLQRDLAYDYQWRTHLALDKDAPITGVSQSPSDGGRIVAVARLGGLHHHDDGRAA